MSYTLLRLAEDGVVLRDYHLRRLGLSAGSAALDSFARFARESEPGVWAVRVEGGRLAVERRGESRLVEEMATRLCVSPVAGLRGPIPKPAPGGVYDCVRVSGVATLLTSADGGEILEACVAAVVGWDGERLVCVPEDRPRVWSCAEQAIRERLSPREAPLLSGGAEPLLLVNAVKETCAVRVPGRPPFPAEAREAIERLLGELTGFLSVSSVR